MKGMQEKESIMGVRGRQKNPFPKITVWHLSESLMMQAPWCYTVTLRMGFSIYPSHAW